MTEIPMPASDPYQQPPKKSSTSSDCCKWGAIICVILIIGMVIIAMVFMGSLLSFFNGGIDFTYDERTLASYNNSDIDIYPAYYYSEFEVYSYETLTSTAPDVNFVISIDDTGNDSVTVTTHFAIYEIDYTDFANLTWIERDAYLIEEGDYSSTYVDSFFDINNEASTYVWVLWFDASSKTSVWTVDIDLILRYNWG